MRRVVKIGGSLFTRQKFVTEVSVWLAKQPIATNWILVGGGDVVNALRNFDSIHPLDQKWIHWRCIELMRTTTALVHQLFPDWPLVADPQEFSRRVSHPDIPCEILVDANAFYSPQHNNILPCSWETTSDGIATLLAAVIDADELVILKSCETSGDRSLSELVSKGIIDPVCGRLAKKLPAIRVETLPLLG